MGGQWTGEVCNQIYTSRRKAWLKCGELFRRNKTVDTENASESVTIQLAGNDILRSLSPHLSTLGFRSEGKASWMKGLAGNSFIVSSSLCC